LELAHLGQVVKLHQLMGLTLGLLQSPLAVELMLVDQPVEQAQLPVQALEQPRLLLRVA
jgi:hypothetical protein